MILVTGGTGLLGSHLLYDLVLMDKPVLAIKRKNSDLKKVEHVFSYYSENYKELCNKIKWIEGDITDIFSLEQIFKHNNITQVYHCAAIVSFLAKRYKSMYRTNVEGTINMVNLCIEYKPEKLCFVSSIAALGRTESTDEITEKTYWQQSKRNNPYSITKYLAEQEVWRASAEGVPVVIVNPSIILGAGFWDSGSGKMIKIAYDGLKFYTRGINGFVDVRDVSKAMIILCNSAIKNERYILNSENWSYEKLYAEIAKNLNKPKPPYFANKLLSAIAWRVEAIRSFFTQKEPLITKYTAKTANSNFHYSNSKIKKELFFYFIPLQTCIMDTCKLLLKDEKNYTNR